VRSTSPCLTPLARDDDEAFDGIVEVRARGSGIDEAEREVHGLRLDARQDSWGDSVQHLARDRGHAIQHE